MKRAETAVLRMADDKYRKTIFNAQVFLNTGAGTYEQAVDMATRDYLSAGINCIEYKNGRRVNIKTYAEMALRTAEKRAYLQGEGEMRKKYGIHTVILNKRSNPCPLCAPFVGKVFVDDVWSGGTAEEAKEKGYPLLSEAIKKGLYHPNCRDSHTTYFGDLDDKDDEDESESETKESADESKPNKEETTAPPDKPDEAVEISPIDDTGTPDYEDIPIQHRSEEMTPEELKHNVEIYNLDQKAKYAEHERVRMQRMGKFSLDKDNQRKYTARAKAWQEKQKELEEKIRKLSTAEDKAIEKTSESGIIKSSNYLDSVLTVKPITDDTIENIPKWQVFLDDEMNVRYQEIAKGLLREAQAYPLGTEVSIICDENMQRIKGHGYVVGTKKGMVPIDKHTDFYHAFHTHPSGETFSLEDLFAFARNDRQLSLTALGNDGSVYFIVKALEFNSLGYSNFLVDAINKDIYKGISYQSLKTNPKAVLSKLSSAETEQLQTELVKLINDIFKRSVDYGTNIFSNRL